MNHTNLLFKGTVGDTSFLSYLKEMVGGKNVRVNCESIGTITEIELYCKKYEITGVFSTSVPLLEKLLNWQGRKTPSLDSYAGSYFLRNGIEYIFLHPLEQFNTVNYSRFLAKRFISKLVSPEKWNPATRFNWELLTATNIEEYFNVFQEKAILVGVDIETFSDPPCIRCVSYTGIFEQEGDLLSISVVLPIDSPWAVAWMRKFNSELEAPKVFQNGKYDNAYFFLYSAPVYNWLFDTANMFHSQYCELPKDLGFLNAFYIREAIYFKDLAETNDLHEYYKYNALDSWATANVAINWLLEASEWAKKNYLMEFPLNFPCHMSEMIGIKRDKEKLLQVNQKTKTEIDTDLTSLRRMIGHQNFNPGSHVQVKQLLRILGCSDIAEKSSDEASLKKAIYRHPLNARILNKILDIRGKRKLISTYIPVGPNGEDIKAYKGRILYALNPHGTDTARLASREHHFWCGLQIHNTPREGPVKETFIADDDFLFAEVDEERAESWDTAFHSGDANLIAAVSSEKDFHSTNASAFFGLKYEDIWDDTKKKVKNKEIRYLSKRINHGANYVMGADVLLDTMGIEEVEKARRLLRLPGAWTPRDICSYLLQQFHRTYPGLERSYYPAVVSAVMKDSKLVAALSWTRWCFGKPDKSKHMKNAYIAHVSQNSNALRLNKAYMEVFYRIALDEKYRNNFRLGPQIHDSILFQFRRGHEYICELVKEMMEIPVTVKAYGDKVERTYKVPASIKAGADGLGALRWSETE